MLAILFVLQTSSSDVLLEPACILWKMCSAFCNYFTQELSACLCFSRYVLLCGILSFVRSF